MIVMPDEISKEFLEVINKYKDCPQKVFQLATTEFEKAVAIEFFNLKNRCDRIDTNMKWIKWLIMGLFTTIVVGYIASFCLKILILV
jgi:hypothetical protein